MPWDSILAAVSALARAGEHSFMAEVVMYFTDIKEKPSAQTQMKILRSSTKAAHFFQRQHKGIMEGTFTAWSSSWDKGWADVEQSISTAIGDVFAGRGHSCATEGERMLKIGRFQRAQSILCLKATEILNQQVLGQLRRRLPDMITVLSCQNWYSQHAHFQFMTSQDLLRAATAVSRAFQEMLAEEIVAAVDGLLESHVDLPIEEPPDIAEQRAYLETHIAKVSASYTFIKQLRL